MQPVTGQGDAARKTLNEVLAAELVCLRPSLKGKVDPSSYAAEPDEREKNLSGIYKIIGSLSKRDASATPRYESLSALCLSGGGIRSATFNLGVLQVLARAGLLGKFDYLSSVSGGGYIASWLRAWMHRRGVENVVKDLGRGAKDCDPLATEPKPVSNLREYSNYLTPAVGLFSGDTWSAAATIARNLILNWLVLVPLLAAVIGIPMLFLLVIRTSGIPSTWSVYLLCAAVVTEMIASGLVYYVRRFFKKPQTPQALFVLLCVVPICLAGGGLATAGIGLGLPWTDPTPNPSGRDWLLLWGFAGIWSIVVPLLGWSAVEAAVRLLPSARRRTMGQDVGQSMDRPDEARQVSRKIEFAALFFSGAVGASLLVGIVSWWFSYLYNHPALYAILMLPLLLGAYLLSRVIFIGIASLSDEQGDPEEGDTGRSDGPAPHSRISSNDSDREWWSRLSGWVLLVIVSWVAVTGICLVGCYLSNFIWWLFGVQEHRNTIDTIVKSIIAVAGAVSGAIAALTGSSADTSAPGAPRSQPAQRSTKLLLAITGPVFVICLIMVLSWGVKALAETLIGPPGILRFYFSRPGPSQPIPAYATVDFALILAGLLVLALVASRFVNVNRFSLHGMYRNRLVRAYLGASNCATDGQDQRAPDPFTGFALNDNLPLHRLCSPPESPNSRAVQRPLSIINTTLNLVHGEKLAWQQRKAESFSMTPLFCGNWLEGYRTSTLYGGPGGLTVGTAVTISGAAANPNMGYSSSPVLGFLMAMFNVRLGAWLGNTNSQGDTTFTHPGPRNTIMPLFAEMFGLTNSNRGYVNLSDGGHFDNLGLYEVVLRRCRNVLVCDAGQDYSFSFEDLGNSIRKIRIDFGIDIEFDTIRILPNTPEEEGLCCAIGRILYSEVDDTEPKADGRLVYIKPTLRGRGMQLPYDIYSYSRGSQKFPHESTADQWFSESQFESYRALGAHILEQLICDPECAEDSDFDDFHASVTAYIDSHRRGVETRPPREGDGSGAGAAPVNQEELAEHVS
jgi:hypothetical protein